MKKLYLNMKLKYSLLVVVLGIGSMLMADEVSDLYNYKQVYMKEALKDPSKVKSILLFGDDNSIEKFNENYKKFTNLEVLSVIGSDCSALAKSATSISSLKGVMLNSCELTNVPNWVGKISQLVLLSMSGNDLTEFPYFLSTLQNLKEIRLGDGIYGGNKIKVIRDSIGLFTSLESLCFYQNKLELISPEIGKLVGLKEFVASQCELKSLPESFGKLINLENLYLHYNPFKSFPKVIFELKNLKELDFIIPDLELDYSIFKRFKNLEDLSVSINNAKEIPQDILDLKGLKSLTLSFCKNLKSKKTIKQLKTLPKLNKLGLYYNTFSAKEKASIKKKLLNVTCSI